MARLTILLFAGCLLWTASLLAAETTATGTVRFNRDIRPILTENCFRCHGPDPGTRKAGMRFDREDGLFGQRKRGRAVVKGDPEQSLLYQRIISDDEDELMPPPESHNVLKPAEKELLRRWIAQGAPWEAHWSFLPPTKPKLPVVKHDKWVRNPIDAFVVSKLEEKGLEPAPEANRPALIRRVSFDLTGLPPTPEEVKAFVDDKSQDSYEKVVDRLLASPTYGEHRARYWLDAARYADTHGLHFDNYREVWPYRDWVINAYNANMPFDQFTIEQLAGDLLPNRTLDQQIASGFNRCNETTNEGGTIPEENLVMYTRDRTETTARVWLGLTVNCAACHDHKFDPITQKDVYSMSAFFNNITMGALDGNIKDTPPVVEVPRIEDRAKWAELTSAAAKLNQRIADHRKESRPQFDAWLASARADEIRRSIPSKGESLSAPLSEGKGLVTSVTQDGDESEIALAADAKWSDGYTSPKALKADKGLIAIIPDTGDFDRNQPFTCSIWAKLPPKANGAIVARMSDKDNYRGWDLWAQNGAIGSHVVSHWPDNAVKVVSKRPVDAKKWHHLCLSYDGTGKAAGTKIYIDGQLQPTKTEADSLNATIRTTVPFKIGQRDSTSPIAGLAVQDLHLFNRALPPEEIRQLASSARLASVVAKAADKRTDAEKKELNDWWASNFDEPSKKLFSELAVLTSEENTIIARGAKASVMEERPEAPKAYVLYRGEYDKRRDEVSAATPSSLPPFPSDLPHNRLGFAKWLLLPENPLTARVTVNRLWQEIFGTGIVRTTEDFGIMGESPSHPELLDWLAVDFRESGWNVKRLLRNIVTSAAYRQNAASTPAKLEKDVANRFLSRGPRFRMDAEMIRDNALAVSGLLVEKIGGPSVKPYQPPGVWEVVGMAEGDTRHYVQDTGEKLYRRSIYTFWKRAAPPASMDILNAPTRETCTVRRERTDTPLQALVTMNDPQFIEAARTLAQNAIKAASKQDKARIDWIARRVLSRPLSSAEMDITQSAVADLRAYYRSSPADAAKLLEVGDSKRDASFDPAEHAAWTMLTNQLMNLDEVLNK
jgi:mono/diheme cytochrome c family protein